MSDASAGPVVEIRVYNVIPDKVAGMVERFTRFHKPMFARHGIGVQGPWIRQLAPGHQMIYLLEFPSPADRDRLWAAYRADPELVDIRERFAAQGRQVATIESTVFHEPPLQTPEA